MYHMIRSTWSNWRHYKTLCLFLGYIVIGQSYGIVGPTLVHMEHVLDTNTQGMAMSFSGDNIGAFIGALICGLLFDQFSYELQFSLGFLWIAVFTTLAPWMPNVYLFCAMMTFRSTVLGYVNSAGKPYMLKLWQGQRYKDAMFQASHATWSLGAFTIPLLVIPFLHSLPNDQDRAAAVSRSSDEERLHFRASRELMQFKNVATILETDFTDATDEGSYLNVRYAYCIIGVSAMLASALFYQATKQGDSQLQSVSGGRTFHTQSPKLQQLDNSTQCLQDQNNPRADRFETLLTVMIFIYTSFTVWQGTILGTFLSAFVIKGLGWSVEKGPLITSVFRGFQGVGRVIGIPVSMYLLPSKILLFNMTLALAAYSIMLSAVIIFQSESLMWLSTAMAGLALSNCYSTTVLWGAQYLSIRASYGSLFVAAASFGGMTSGFLAGYLFQHYEPQSVIYIILFAVLFNIVMFCVMNATARLYVHYRNNNANQASFCDVVINQHLIKTI